MRRKPDLYERVGAALREGKVWRAKEILRGNIATRGYDRPLYERYGQLLLQLGEAVEAGKYLFLSGERRPDYEEPIRLYLQRYTRKDPRNLVGTFPTAARLELVDEYPQAVRETLRALDFADKPLPPPPGPARGRRLGSVVTCGCLVVLGAAFVLGCLGIGIAIDWLLEHW